VKNVESTSEFILATIKMTKNFQDSQLAVLILVIPSSVTVITHVVVNWDMDHDVCKVAAVVCKKVCFGLKKH